VSGLQSTGTASSSFKLEVERIFPILSSRFESPTVAIKIAHVIWRRVDKRMNVLKSVGTSSREHGVID